MDWLQIQLIAINAHIKMRGDEPADDYMDSAEYCLGYRDAIKRAIKFYKMMKEVE